VKADACTEYVPRWKASQAGVCVAQLNKWEIVEIGMLPGSVVKRKKE